MVSTLSLYNRMANKAMNDERRRKWMFTIYLYVLDTLADWEIGHVTAELNSGRFFKEGAQRVSFKWVGCTKKPVQTMGRLSIAPDCLVDEIPVDQKTMLLLPGADTWNDPRHGAVIEKARELLSVGATVCAICGATVALASAGLLKDRPHTSNGVGFLDMMAPGYTGQAHYVDEPSVADQNLITASGTGALLWAKQIIERLEVFKPDTLEAWYQYFCTGKPECFFAMMKSLPQGGGADTPRA